MTVYTTIKLPDLDEAPTPISDSDETVSSDVSELPAKKAWKRNWGDIKAYILSGLAASSIVNTPAGGISATTVQAALNELDTEKINIASHAALSVVGRSANSVGNAADIALSNGQFLGVRASVLGGYTPAASEISNTPAGNISATDVQAAINELDTEKAGLAISNVFSVSQTIESAVTNVSMNITADGFLAQQIMTAYLAASNGPNFNVRHARGTKATPTALLNADQCGGFTWTGHSGSGFVVCASMRADLLAATPGPTDMETAVSWRMCSAGSASAGLTFQVGGSLGVLYQNVTVLDSNRIWRNRVYTVGTLPAAGTAGRRTFVSDANAPVFGAAVAGGGAVNVPVYDTGAAWFVG